MSGTYANARLTRARRTSGRPRGRILVSRQALQAAFGGAVLLAAAAFGAGYAVGVGRGTARPLEVEAPIAELAPPAPAAQAPEELRAVLQAPAPAAPPAEPPPPPPTQATPAEPKKPAEPEAPAEAPLKVLAEGEVPAEFGVQLGAFPSVAEAQVFVRRHAAALGDTPLFLVAAEIKGRGTWFRVRAGAAKTRSEAEALRKKLPAEIGRDALVLPYR